MGTGEVASFFVMGAGYCCGRPTSPGRLFNDYDQYVLCLQGTASKMLELSLGSRDFPGRSPDGSYGTVAAFYGSGGPDVNNIRLVYNVTF